MTEYKKIRRKLIQIDKDRKAMLQPRFAQIGLALGHGHARILECLLAKDGVTQKELADLCRLDVGTISRSLDRLSQSGFLVRQRDPDCRRAFLIYLTPEGQEEARKAHQILEELDDQMMAGFSPEEIQVFDQFLTRMMHNLNST